MSDIVTRVVGITLLCCALQATFVAAEAEPEAALSNLSAQEQQEYKQRLENAGSEQQRAAVQAEYQAMSRERSRQQHTHGKHNGSGGGSPNIEGKSGPAGNKNKPQKKGG
jgi:hypothetical protein